MLVPGHEVGRADPGLAVVGSLVANKLAAEADDANSGLTIRPAGRAFRGQLIVLTDASNSSATFGFSQLVKASRLGVLIGEPTGGNRRGINGGRLLIQPLGIVYEQHDGVQVGESEQGGSNRVEVPFPGVPWGPLDKALDAALAQR